MGVYSSEVSGKRRKKDFYLDNLNKLLKTLQLALLHAINQENVPMCKNHFQLSSLNIFPGLLAFWLMESFCIPFPKTQFI